MENKHTVYDLAQMQSLPLESKIQMAKSRIREYYEAFDGDVFVSFSGGKDSTVLKHIVESMYKDVPSVFVNTGLEYPEIQKFVMQQENVTVVRPKKRFDEVIKEYGYPIIGKKQARYIRDLQNANDNNKATVNLRLTGINRNGEYCPSMVLPKKWIYLKDAPFKVSEQCCDVMKKQALHSYEKKTGRVPITGVMAEESSIRTRSWLRLGCNSFNGKGSMSRPLSVWTEQDILQYLKEFNVPYSSIYGDILQDFTGRYYTTGEQRTGCIFCMFGCHLEKSPNRFQRLKVTHPAQYEYCMKPIDKGGLGLADVLEYIGVEYR